MKKTNKIILFSFCLLVLFSSLATAETVLGGAMACTNTNHEVIESNNPRQEIVSNWNAAINKQNLGGKSWVGKLQSNGPNDNNNRVDTGRETIIFVPCTTDFNKKVEIMYFFHGLTGFSYFEEKDKSYNDMNLRLAPQAKELSEKGRNFVIVFPEMPWSAGTAKRSNQNDIWKEGDSNLIQLHGDVQNILKQNFNPSVDIGYVSMVGHSAGGAALRHAATRPSQSNNALKEIGVNKIVFSDSDYGWGFGSSTPWEKQPSALLVYEHYLQYNSNAEMYMLVQDPSRSGAHRPTQFAILTVKKLGSQYDPQIASWHTEDIKWDTSNKEESSTPGAVTGQIFKVPGHPNINYLPLNIAHKNIGKMSLAWTSGSGISSYLGSSIQKGQISAKYSGGQTPTAATNKVSRNIPKQQEEIDEVWVKIGPSVMGSNLIYNPDNGNWEDFTNTYYTFQQISSQSVPKQQPSQQLTGQCFPLTQDSFNRISDNWGDDRNSKTFGTDKRCHAGIDIYSKSPGNVVAIADGVVTHINKEWYSCEDGWGIEKEGLVGKQPISAVLVYHPSLGKTVNYGEIDSNKLLVNTVGSQITKGQKLGVASYCDMLHVELYNGKVNSPTQWFPPTGESTAGENKCANQYLGTKPNVLQDPTSFIKQLQTQGNFCNSNAGSTSQFCEKIKQPPNSQFIRSNYLSSGTLKDFNQYRALNYGYFNPEDQVLNPTSAKDNADTTSFMGINLKFNKRLLPALKCVELELVGGVCNNCVPNSKYPNECQTNWKKYPYQPSKISSLRTKNSYRGSEISNHVFGIAIDFDPQSSGNYGNSCCGCVGNWKDHDFCKDSSLEPYQQMVMPSCWIDVFEKYGFYWLGNDKLEDTMHFEFLGDAKIIENQVMSFT
jgi:murein DD-endopeptidase MepM/ murein hydrolase activator NlpD